MGQITLEETPSPVASAGRLLVRTNFSCISVGTELAGTQVADSPLWLRALKNPEKIIKAAKMAATEGIRSTIDVAKGLNESSSAMGYSASGIVVDAGSTDSPFNAGDRVACAGTGNANHAEYISVPYNLAVRVPAAVGDNDAASVALGAIALQGIRRLQPTIGETFVVFGLGLLGQLTSQMLRSAGCRVIGADVDYSRTKVALDLGMHCAIEPGDNGDVVKRLTAGRGADGVIITASSESSELISQAFGCCRRKARVVVVGDVGLNLHRHDIYAKELDILISTSYGPGRYDRRYESEGLDYPLAYVRWTENRNMEEYLQMIADGRINLSGVCDSVFSIDQAAAAYESLKSEDRPIGVLLSYANTSGLELARKVVVSSRKERGTDGQVRTAIVGSGQFMNATLLPIMQKMPEYYAFEAVMSRSGLNAKNTAAMIGAKYATSDLQEVLSDSNIDLVIVGTRHNLHASIAVAALEAGKNVLVEKPLATTEEDLKRIETFFNRSDTSPKPMLMTGFNRRFSPIARRLSEKLSLRQEPMIISYQMNAGHIPAEHWVHSHEGGGRNIGEACHIYDLFSFLTGAQPLSVVAQGASGGSGFYCQNDNFSTSIRYTDGSVATLTYTAFGDAGYPKETMQVFCEGVVYVMEDFTTLKIHSKSASGDANLLQSSGKGHHEEYVALGKTLRDGDDWPISLQDQISATRISFQVEEALRGGNG